MDKGVYIESVTVNGPAYKAGLRRGDVILSIGDKETNKVSDVRNTILDSKVGDSVKVKYERNGNVSTVDVALEAAS